MTNNSIKLRMMIITAIFAAIIGILAQLNIPLPLVPITGQTLAIGLAATILGAKYGTLSVILYILLGAAGIPVFAEMQAGLSVLFGPTGGYLAGFVPTSFFIGWILENTSYSFKNALAANIIGMLITLTFGTAWLKIAADLSWTAAFTGGFAPFLVVGVIKAALASWIGITVRKRLQSANLLYTTKTETNITKTI